MKKFFDWIWRNDQAPIPFAVAKKPFSEGYAVSGNEAGHVLGGLFGDAMVPYSINELKKAARENEVGKHGWVLFCTFRLPYRCLGKCIKGFSALEDDIIASDIAENPSSEYVLIDLKPRCRGFSWDQQERYLKVHPDLLRVRSDMLVEVMYILNRLYGIRVINGLVHLGELRPLFDLHPGDYPRRICGLPDGRAELQCLPISTKTRSKNSCMIVMRKPRPGI